MKPFAKQFYASKAWKNCRKSYISQRMLIDGGLCEECHEEQGYILHHKILLTEQNINNPNISLNHSNLKYVCKKCHDQYEGHGVGTVVPLDVLFDKDGMPIGRRNG